MADTHHWVLISVWIIFLARIMRRPMADTLRDALEKIKAELVSLGPVAFLIGTPTAKIARIVDAALATPQAQEAVAEIADLRQQLAAVERSQHSLQSALLEAQQARERAEADAKSDECALVAAFTALEEAGAPDCGESSNGGLTVPWLNLAERVNWLRAERDTLRGLLREAAKVIQHNFGASPGCACSRCVIHGRITAALKEVER